MKQFLFNVVSFFKRLGILRRIIALGFVLVLLFTMFIPDLTFNLAVKDPKKFTIEEIQAASKSDLPRYMIIDNAQVMRASNPISEADMDSLTGGKIKGLDTALQLMTLSYNYVRQEKTKRGVTSLMNITYPVYSKSQIEKSPNSTAAQLTSFVVIKDAHVTDAQLEDDKYFNDSTFTIKGKFDGSKIDAENLKLLRESGYNISEEAIVLEKGDTPMSLNSSLILTIIGTLLSIIGILSFFPDDSLHKLLGTGQGIV